ncbi:MAG TPA: MFS transporter [Streptosporangiaceae bacterium]|nr:MFS transporter [Streptosporangiaceae bacterium]
MRSGTAVIGRVPALASLADRRFRWWFGAQVLSASGTMTQAVAASWLVLRLTGSAVDLAVLTALTVGPALVLGAWAGSLADRLDRRRLLVLTQATFVVLGLALAGCAAAGAATVPVIFVLTGLTGVTGALDAPARQVFVLDLVGPRQLASAVSLWEVVINLSRIVGPATGGLLLTLSGPAACFAVNALSYLPAIALLARRPARPWPGAGAAAAGEHAPGVRAGLSYAWGVPAIRGCVLMAACTAIIFTSGAILPPLAARTFHLGAGGYSLLLACFGLGALPGALLAAARSATAGMGRVITLALLTSAAVVAVALAPTPGVACAAMAVAGFTSIWFVAAANTLVQLRAAPAMRGRVMGIWTMALPGVAPVSALLAGVLVDDSGPRAGFAAAGVCLAAAALLAAWWLRPAARPARPGGPPPG